MGERVNNNNSIFSEIESEFDDFIKSVFDTNEFNEKSLINQLTLVSQPVISEKLISEKLISEELISENSFDSDSSSFEDFSLRDHPVIDHYLINDSLINPKLIKEFNNEAADAQASLPPPSVTNKPETIPCSLCGRKFLPDRLPKHVNVCQKSKQKKRKPFDSRVQRKLDEDGATGSSSDISSLIVSSNASANGSEKGSESNYRKGNWRQQHEEFISTVRAARGYKPGKKDNHSGHSGQSGPSKRRPGSGQYESTGSDERKIPAGYITCPTCDRSFARKAADRHIPWCANQAKERQYRSPTPGDPEKMAKLKARTTYKKGQAQTYKDQGQTYKDQGQTYKDQGQTDGSRVNGSHRQPVIKGRRTGIPSTVALNESMNHESMNHGSVNHESVNHGSVNHESVNHGSVTKTSTVTRRTQDKTRNMTRHTQSVSPVKRTSGQAYGQATRPSPTLGRNGVRRPSPTLGTESRVKAQLIANERKLLPKTPIVKFKDKFPHHNYSGATSKYMEEGAQSLKELFKRPDTLANFPRTVPGVRTGGMTPTNDTFTAGSGSGSGFGFGSGSGSGYGYTSGSYGPPKQGPLFDPLMKNTLTIVKKSLEDLYLGGEGRERPSAPVLTPGSLGNHSISSIDLHTGMNGGSLGMNGGSVGMNGQRGSTSGSSDGGKNGRDVGSKNESSGQSAVEGQTGLTVSQELDRESSIESSSSNGKMPRWCHQCGTKYPLGGAKYCYECGAKRLQTGSPFLTT